MVRDQGELDEQHRDGQVQVENGCVQDLLCMEQVFYSESSNLDSWRSIRENLCESIEYFNRKFVHDVVSVFDNGGISKSLGFILRGSSKVNLLAIGFHEEGPGEGHLHVLHDCPWYNYECRCFRGLACRPRKNAVHGTYESTSAVSILAIIQYIFNEPRRPIMLKIRKLQRKFFDRVEHITDPGYRWDSISGEISQEVEANEICVQSRQQSNGDGETNIRQGRERVTGRRVRTKAIPENLAEYIMTLCTYPLENIVKTKQWRESEYKFVLPSDAVFIRAIDYVKGILCSYRYQEFVKLYHDVKHPIFLNIHNTDYYYTPEESLKIADELLKFQLESLAIDVHQDIEDIIKQFITDLFKVCEKLYQKKNTFYVVSPPSAGKNFFFDSILEFYLNTGSQKNLNRFSSFPFMDCVNRRINIWNEPNFVKSAEEELKKLLGGDSFTVDFKYLGQQMIVKTPLIVLSNLHVFHEQPFLDRTVMYIWQRADYLIKYNKRLHPLVWVKLVEKYVDKKLYQ